MRSKTEMACAKVALTKLQAGKQITAREQEILERYEAEQSETSPPGRLMVTYSEFAEVIGVKLLSVPRLVKSGLPVRGNHIYLPDAIQWWARRSGHELKASQARYWRSKERTLAMRVAQARRELLPKREVLEAVDGAVRLLAMHLSRLPKRLEPHVGRDVAEEIEREIRQMMDGIAQAAQEARA